MTGSESTRTRKSGLCSGPLPTASLASHLLGPRRRDPAALAELAVQLPVVAVPLAVVPLARLWGVVLAQELPHLATQLIGSGAQAELHAAQPTTPAPFGILGRAAPFQLSAAKLS